MSIHINSDKEKFQGSKPKLVGNDELTVRGGTGSLEKEILRTQLDASTGLPRVGINRTGQRVNDINILTGGSGYISPPTVEIAPPIGDGVQAQGSAFIFNGQVVSVAINEPGRGYTQAPLVTLSGGGGVGASAEALLDTVDFELDINGAIRTSTSIISDTARILNLDIDNFVTPNAAFRAPSLKTFINNSGTLWSPGIILQENAYRYFGQNVYQALNSGQTGSSAPVHTDGTELNGEVNFKHIGFRVVDQNAFGYSATGPAGEFPRSITPLLGDRSDKIATTEYVLNLATNDVGGRIYVSQQIGSDLNDGRSAVNPVRSIKKAAQLAWATVGVKETIICSGGDYVEDNPISLPPDASVVGDNLRLVIIRPANPGKHIFKFGDKNYVTGVTYRDKIDSNGDAVATWDFAMVFDDKQRILVDADANGDFGTSFPIGHQIFGPQQFRVTFQNNTGLSTLVTGLQVVGVNTGARATIQKVTFDTQTGASAYVDGTIDIKLDSGSFVEGEQFNYVTGITHNAGSPLALTSTGTTATNKITFTTDPTSVTPAGTYVYLSDVGNATFTPSAGYYEVTQIEPNDINNPTSWEVSYLPILGSTGWTTIASASIEVFTGNAQVETLNTTNLKSIRAEGEVVAVDEDYTTSLPISRLDFSLQGDPSIATGGFQQEQFGNAEDLGGIVFYTNALVGRTNTHEFKEGQEILIEGLPTSSPDLSALNGRQRIYKVIEDADGRCRRFVIPKKYPAITTATFDPGQFATVKTATKSVTLSLLNSPNTFELSSPVDRRFQDACTFLRNNRDFIADEVVGKINDQFARYFYSAYNISGNSFDIFVGLAEQEHTYVSGGTVKFGGTTYNVTNFVYNNAVTGVATVTTDNPVAGLAEDDHIKLENMTLSCDAGQKIYPSYSSPSANGSDGDLQCKQDVIHFVNAVIRDLEFGTNHNVIEAAQKYIVGGKITYIEDEIIQNVRAIEYARELCIFAMRNWRIGNGTPTEPIYAPQYSSVARYFDDTVITTTAGTPACANVASAIDTLAFLWVDVISNNSSGTYLDAAYLIARNKDLIADQALLDTESAYPSLNLSDTHQRKCRRDIRIVLNGLIRDLVLGGNNGIVTVAESYFTGVQLTGISEAQRPSTLYAFQRAKLYALECMRNWCDGNVIEVTPNNSTYNSTSGETTVSFPNPVINVSIGDRIAFKEEAITYSCTYNSVTGNHASPERFDSNFGNSYEITNLVRNATTTTITCNVGDAGAAAGVSHTYVSAKTDGTVIIYNPTVVTSTIPKFEDWNILIDEAASPATAIFTPTAATYDPSNGDFVMTVGSGHGVTTSNFVRLDEESFVFTCAMDGNKTEHALPQAGQPAYGNARQVTATSTDTITINVGASGPDQRWTPSAATYDPATGYLQLTIGAGHNLSIGEGVVIADNSLSFTCTMDNNSSTKTYPRPGIDPFAGRSMPIIAKTEDTITVNAGISGPNVTFTPTNAFYDPSTGDLTLTVGQHGLGVGRGIIIADESLVFTCAQDGGATQHAYPRSTDPASGSSRSITSVGTTSHTVTDADYTPSTGNLQLTIPNHGFANGDYVRVLNSTLLFTCELDGNTVQKSYPRDGYDYASNRWLQVSNVTTNTFDINIGGSSYTGAHTFTGAVSNGVRRQDGTLTVNVGTSSNTTAHSFVNAAANSVSHSPQSAHTFVSASTDAVAHLPQSAHTFVRTTTESVQVFASSGANPLCANVATSINTIFGTFEDILDGTTAAGSTARTYGTLYDTSLLPTYPDNFIYDANNQRVAIRGDFDDYPIIEASPYTQNASVISFLGGGGAEIDGDKVKQPNCPFPGLELDGTASFPNQGKSMVAAAFTIVSFGGTGYKVINDGYTQLVSVFVIFCADGVLCESGGYASITNSATNFGQYALRGTGFRKDPYTFDVATISNVSATPTGRTILTVTGLGREPLEHYVAKIDGYRNTNPDIEYFIDVVAGVTVGPPFSAQLTFDDGTGGAMDLTDTTTNQAVSTGVLLGKTINLHRPSIVNSSSHTWEFAGSGTNYLALPENGGTKIEAFEQVSEDYGRVYVSGTDELGDFKVGTFARIENRTGAITFTGTVTISEVEFLKLKGGDVVVTGFDASNTLGGATSSDSKLPTQKAVKDYITNSLGPYINKPYSTNAVPRALVELTDSGKISIDQIPALRPFSVFTVANLAERTSLEGALAGDIAIQQDTSQSFILNNDNDSLFLGFAPDPALVFNVGDVYTGSLTTGRIQATEYRKGVVYQINVTNGGSGYTVAPTITFSGGNPEAGAVAAAATCTIANGSVVTVTIIDFNNFKGGKGYTTAPTVTFSAPPGAGTQAQGNALIESRLYGDIVNNIKIEDTDTFDDSATPTANTVNINRVINTSSFNANNWVSLSSNQIAASDITSGVIETDRLASGGAANSFTFLRGDQNFALAVQSIKGAETRYFAKLAAQCNSGSNQMIFTTNSDVLIGHDVLNNVAGIANNTNITGVVTAAGLTTISLNNPVTQNIPINTIIEFERGESPMTFESSFTQGGFIDDVIIAAGGSGYTNGQYFDVDLQGGTGTGLKANIVVSGNAVTEITVTDGGTGYNADFSITVSPTEIGAGSSLVLNAKVSTVNRQYANVSLDINRVTDLTISADLYGTIGVSRYKKSQFNIGQAGNGSVELKMGPDSGLDADLLDGQQGSYYTSASNLFSGTIPTDRMAGTYNIDVSGSSNNTIRLQTGTNNPTSNPNANSFVEGVIANTVFNSSNGLGTAYPSVNTGIGSGTSTKHLVLTLRNGASGFDASFGGVRQLAFANDDNMYLRGSGNGVTTWNSWAKVWTSLSDGVDSGLDADRLDNRQGDWYQNALNINYGTLSDNRLPRFISETKVRDKVTIKSFSGDPKYRIYVSGSILNTAPFIPGDPNNPSINLYNANAQGVGSFVLDNVITNDDVNDNFNDYTILIGRLTSGNFVGALTIGTASNRVEFDDFTIEDGNTVEVANLESNGGVAQLQLGRKDGNTSSPSILFNSSQVAADYNARIQASGGNGSNGSGALNVDVVNANALTVNNQVVWNQGNIQFSSANTPNYAVQRDGSGNFSAGTITANVTGAASLNVLKTGDTMTGSLNITGVSNSLTVAGQANLNYFVFIGNDLNVDSGALFVDASANEVGINAGTNPLATLDVVGDSGILVRTVANGASAKIKFTDQAGAFTQSAQLRYNHQDSASPNNQYGEGFTVEGTGAEAAGNLYFRVVGDVIASRNIGINLNRKPNYNLEVNGTGFFQSGIILDSANDNSGAPITFVGSSSYRNFRVGNQIVGNHLWTVQASTNNGGQNWNGTPAISVKGDVNAVSINTTSTSGTDPETNTNRNYKFNVQGDMNINGQFFQNNAEFVTSRWTEASNGNDIYRQSRVGINRADPTYQLHISGDTNIENGVLYANGVKQWLDSYGIFKANSNTVAENITVPANVNCVSAGPITIANGYTVTINSGGNWAIV